MNTALIIDNDNAVTPEVVGARKVNTSAGTSNGSVSAQWASRAADQKFLSLADLEHNVLTRNERSRTVLIDSKAVRVIADKNDPRKLELAIDDKAPVVPTHWSFNQLAGLAGAPPSYLRKLPAFLSAVNLQYGLSNFREEQVKAFVRSQPDGQSDLELAAFTGPDYGRVFDHEVVAAVRKVAGNGTGDTAWKVPGVLDWRTGIYDPNVAITKQTTTLFASDRDVFVFLVDDTHPIEIGKLPSGEPDYLFRGFYVWNSEVGSKSLGIGTFLFRAVCCNRILWGVEKYEELRIRHSKLAPQRFIDEAAPALAHYANQSTDFLLSGITKAREAVVATNTEAQVKFLHELDKNVFTKSRIDDVLDRVRKEEGHEAANVWDFVQGITAVARDIPHQDDRVAFEAQATKLLRKVA